jgi:hypothetical protein
MGTTVTGEVEELTEIARDQAVRRASDLLHYLVSHANVKQYYYELKFVRDDRKFLNIIAKALKELDVLKRDSSEAEKMRRMRLLEPDKDDETKILEYYYRFRERFIALLSAMVVGACPLCWEKD